MYNIGVLVINCWASSAQPCIIFSTAGFLYQGFVYQEEGLFYTGQYKGRLFNKCFIGKSVPTHPEASDNLLEALHGASMDEEHRTLMSSVIRKVSSAKSGLTKACTSLLTGFEVSNKYVQNYHPIGSSPWYSVWCSERKAKRRVNYNPQESNSKCACE